MTGEVDVEMVVGDPLNVYVNCQLEDPVKLAVTGTIGSPEQYVAPPEMDAVGNGLMVIVCEPLAVDVHKLPSVTLVSTYIPAAFPKLTGLAAIPLTD